MLFTSAKGKRPHRVCGTWPPVQKQDGCNKMTCWRCGTYFCWMCGLALKAAGNPYQHFSDPKSSCFNKLFEGADEEEDPAADEDDHEFGEFL